MLQFAEEAFDEVPLTITKPNGLKFSLGWDSVHLCQDLPGEPCAVIHTYQRLSGVISSASYQLAIGYASDSIGSWPNPNPDWFKRTSVGFYRLTSATFSTGGQGITNAFDALSRLTSTTSTMGGTSRTLSYGYDLAGQRTQITHPDGAYFTTGYDMLGRAWSASWTTAGGTTPFIGIGYDNLGRRTTTTLGSSYTDYGFDNVSRLTTLTQRFAGNTGNSTQSLSYNPASQITSETRDNDAFAFPTSQIGSVDRAYAANSLNQYTSAGPVTFSYDAKGNLTSDGNRTYSYDAENRLVTAVSGGVTTNLTYDPLGRLFQVDQGTTATTTRFLYDGAELAAEYNGSNAMTKRYYFGPGNDEPMIEDTGGALNCSGTKFLHANQQGSIIALADCWGNQTNVNSYDEYGIPASNTGRFQYTGQMWIPELGMSYYKNRVYSPTLGRFLQTDPIGYDGDGPNLYAYVLNDPVNFIDPVGLAAGADIGVDGCFGKHAWMSSICNPAMGGAFEGFGSANGGSNDPGPARGHDDGQNDSNQQTCPPRKRAIPDATFQNFEDNRQFFDNVAAVSDVVAIGAAATSVFFPPAAVVAGLAVGFSYGATAVSAGFAFGETIHTGDPRYAGGALVQAIGGRIGTRIGSKVAFGVLGRTQISMGGRFGPNAFRAYQEPIERASSSIGSGVAGTGLCH